MEKNTTIQVLSSSDQQLIIKLDYTQPIGLSDLSKSLMAFENEFETFVQRHSDPTIPKDLSLKIREIRKGSLIFDIVQFVAGNPLPFIEVASNIGKFIEHIQTIIEVLKNGGEPEASVSEIKNVHQIIDPVAKDGGAQMIISTGDNSPVTVNYVINNNDANVVQNRASQLLKSLNQPIEAPDEYKSVVLSLEQARNPDAKTDKGNKAKIEEIGKRALNLTFENDHVKDAILSGHDNPFQKAFVVDVKIQTVDGKPIAYKVLGVHDVFDRGIED